MVEDEPDDAGRRARDARPADARCAEAADAAHAGYDHHRHRRRFGDVSARRFDPGAWMVAQFHDLRRRLITKAEVCHARHPNQSLLAWAIGAFLVSQIMVGAAVAPLGARFWPVVWRGIGVC